LTALIQRLSLATKRRAHCVNEYLSLAGEALRFAFARPFYFQDFVQRRDEICVESLDIVLLTGFFNGMVPIPHPACGRRNSGPKLHRPPCSLSRYGVPAIVYSTVARSIEKSRMDEVRDTPLRTIIETPVAPPRAGVGKGSACSR
jgi:hypothetical protein